MRGVGVVRHQHASVIPEKVQENISVCPKYEILKSHFLFKVKVSWLRKHCDGLSIYERIVGLRLGMEGGKLETYCSHTLSVARYM